MAKAKNIREDADYGDFIDLTEEDAQVQIERAKKFVKEAERVMKNILNNNNE